VLLVSGQLLSQSKSIQATKIAQPPKIDGLLNDAAWLNVPIATDFIQNFPNVGSPTSQKTEVRIVYDDDAIYVAAYLYDDPALIRRQITARDEEQQKDLDFFSVFFDTYKDQQNGFQFLVTSSNVQTDARLAPNLSLGLNQYGDKTWDAVWDSKVVIADDGWIVEMKIPYISLRFPKFSVQTWGVQFQRSVRRNNETTFWNHVDPQVNGFVNQFGILQDLLNIKPPLRLSFSPYISTGVRSTPKPDGYRTEWLKSGGMDVKYGINESFTLDATLVPDFGQVISDNVVNNLTPYEVRFDEYRPFFTEGTEIFDKSGLFYSRRIGATPSGAAAVDTIPNSDPNIEVVRNPGRTQLYNGIKLSGRTPKKLGIGFFNTVGAPMYAIIRDRTTGERERIKTEDLTNYNIIVLDQALKGRSYVTFTNTNVIRSGAARDANVTGIDFSLYDKKNIYNLKGYSHYSKVFSADSYDGYNTALRIAKVSGKLRFHYQNLIQSVDYDPTDLGYLQTANQHVNTATIGYYQLSPTKNFLNQVYSVTAEYRKLQKPGEFIDFSISASGFWYFKNFWDVRLVAGYLPDQHDYFVTGRPFNRYARRPKYGYLNMVGSSDSRKRLFVSLDLLGSSFFGSPEKEYFTINTGLRYRFSNKLTLELSHRHEAETDYITNYGQTPSGEPVIAFVDFKDVTSIISGIYNFTPRINLTVRIRHYWSHVPVKRTAQLDNDGFPIVVTPVSGVTDNINFFNSDAFFTWDFRYGSRVIIGYKNWLGENEMLNGNSHKAYIKNLGKSFGLRHGNELTARFIYFLDYNQLRKKRR
jgi:hypothetical protein